MKIKGSIIAAMSLIMYSFHCVSKKKKKLSKLDRYNRMKLRKRPSNTNEFACKHKQFIQSSFAVVVVVLANVRLCDLIYIAVVLVEN